jgi:transcriptional regulator with XRE-family HTH domain
MRGGVLLREARELAGLTQAGLAARAGTTQSAIARIENGTEPTFARLRELVATCGVSLQVHLGRFEGSDERLAPAWRPDGPVGALSRMGVSLVLGGRAAAAMHGVAVDVGIPLAVPDPAREAVERLAAALDEVGARRRAPSGDGTLPLDRSAASLLSRRSWELETADGPIDLDHEPAGTRGYADLARRAVTIEGVRVPSAADTARMLDAAGDDLALVTALRDLAL